MKKIEGPTPKKKKVVKKKLTRKEVLINEIHFIWMILKETWEDLKEIAKELLDS